MNQKTIKIVIPVLALGLSLTSYFILKEEKPTKVLSEKEKFYQFMEGDTNLYESKIKSQIKAKNKIFPEIFNELLKSDFRTASIASLACFPFSDFQEQILKFNEKDMGVYISNFSCRYYSADLSALDKIASLGHSREQKLENLRNLMEWNKTSASFKPIRLNQIVLPYYLKEFKNSDEVFKILAEYENSYPYINPVLKTLYNSEDLMERKTGIKFLSMIDPAYIKEQFKVLKNLTEPPLSEIVLASLPYVCPKEKWSYLEKMLKKDLSGSELLSMVGSLSRIGGDRPLQILKKLEISRNIKNEKLMIQNAILARKKATRINCQ